MPLEEHDFSLNEEEFHDAISLIFVKELKGFLQNVPVAKHITQASRKHITQASRKH